MRVLLARTVQNNIRFIQHNLKKLEPKYIIVRKHCGRPQYYVVHIYGYKWTTNIDKATVFRGLEQAKRELQSTTVTYEAYVEVVSLRSCRL